MTLVGVAIRNLRRNPLRTGLTVAGVAVGAFAFLLIQTVIAAWNIGVTTAATDRVVTRHKVTFLMSLPKRYVEQVRQTPGVKQATWNTWFGGKHPQHDREFFMALGVEPETWLDVYDEIGVSPEARTAWAADRQGAIVGDVLASKFGWKTGDTVRSDIFAGEWEFRIHAIYQPLRKSAGRDWFIFDWDYLNESPAMRDRDQVGWITSRVTPGTGPAALAQALDARFDENEVQTLSQDELAFNRGFLGMFSTILAAMGIVSIVILGIMGLILGNTVAMGVRERVREHGVLRALGFRPGHLTALTLAEAAALGAGGAAVGLGLAVPFIALVLGPFVEEHLSMFFQVFRLQGDTVTLTAAACVGMAALAGVVPAWQAARLRVVEALRQVA